MKYKVGDKIVLKTWEELESNYPSALQQIAINGLVFHFKIEKKIRKNFSDRVFTVCNIIKGIRNEIEHYHVKEILLCITDEHIEGLVEDMRVKNIFELLDL
jgi:hypothetical protein